MTREQLETLIDAVERRSTNMGSYVHGPRHWRCVSLVGVRLARRTPGADALVAFLFGLFHDAMRENDDMDFGHGVRGASLASDLSLEGLLPLDDAHWESLIHACRTHTEAGITTRALVGVCYDADRLNLWRVGTRPSPLYLSTEAGREMARRNATEHLHDSPLTWGDVLNELFAARTGR